MDQLCKIIDILLYFWFKSRFEQAPGSEFCPGDESKKVIVVFGTSWGNKKIDLERYVLCGLYEILLFNIANRRYEK